MLPNPEAAMGKWSMLLLATHPNGWYCKPSANIIPKSILYKQYIEWTALHISCRVCVFPEKGFLVVRIWGQNVTVFNGFFPDTLKNGFTYQIVWRPQLMSTSETLPGWGRRHAIPVPSPLGAHSILVIFLPSGHCSGWTSTQTNPPPTLYSQNKNRSTSLVSTPSPTVSKDPAALISPASPQTLIAYRQLEIVGTQSLSCTQARATPN